MSTEAGVESLAPLAGLIDTTTVDGIPTLLARREGPLFAGIVFRVGRGDETLATAGITHLVEHLALFRMNMADLHHNGQTANTHTLFHATGSPDEVVAFLNDVCASLRDLPLQRLETEKEILRTEAARRTGGRAFEAMSMWRYGARGPGLVAYDEEGLARLSAEDVAGWVRSRFTRDNAVLFLTNDSVPEGLDLTLPAGRRVPVVLPPETLPHKPAWFSGPGGGIVLDAVVPRSTPALVFARLTDRMLFRHLRQEGGLSYTATCDYEPLDAANVRITACADALPEKQDAAVHAMIATLQALRDGRVSADDLSAARKQLQQPLASPDLGASLLPATALNLLTGYRSQHPDELRAEQDAVTVADVTAVARAFWADALAQVPGDGLDWAGFTPAPTMSRAAVLGFSYPRMGEPDVALVIGDDGVSLRTPKGVVTVRYDECVLMSTVPDGARMLIGADGFSVVVEPTLYRGMNEGAIAMIDAHVPHGVVRHLPQRLAGQIPRPGRALKQFRLLPQWRGLGEWARTTGIFLMCVAGVSTLIAWADLASMPASGVGATMLHIVAVVLPIALAWAGAGLLVFGAARRRAL